MMTAAARRQATVAKLRFPGQISSASSRSPWRLSTRQGAWTPFPGRKAPPGLLQRYPVSRGHGEEKGGGGEPSATAPYGDKGVVTRSVFPSSDAGLGKMPSPAVLGPLALRAVEDTGSHGRLEGRRNARSRRQSLSHYRSRTGRRSRG